MYAHPAYVEEDDCVIFDDVDYGEREVCAQHYYDADGTLFIWDAQFGIWVSSRGYYLGGAYYPGWHSGWRSYYHSGWYHPRGTYYRSYPRYRYYGGQPYHYRGRR